MFAKMGYREAINRVPEIVNMAFREGRYWEALGTSCRTLSLAAWHCANGNVFCSAQSMPSFINTALLRVSGAVQLHDIVRPSPSDFDEWERLGATGWGYKDLHP
jgi:choline dehydrogenase-like flavoprotein